MRGFTRGFLLYSILFAGVCHSAGSFGGLVVPNMGQVKNGDWRDENGDCTVGMTGGLGLSPLSWGWQTRLSPLFEKRGLTAKTGTVPGDVGRAVWTVPAFVGAAGVPVPALKNGDWLKRSVAETCLSPLFKGGEDVRYYMDAPWGRLYVTEQGLLLSIIVPEDQAGGIEAAPTSSGRGGGGGRRPDGNFDHHEPRIIHQTAILLDLPGACWREVIPEDPQVTKLNFFYGNDPKGWVTDVPTYGRLRFKGIFPGTDLILETKSPDFWRMEGFQDWRLTEIEAKIIEKLRQTGAPWAEEAFVVRSRANRPLQPPHAGKDLKVGGSVPRAMQSILWGTYLGGAGNDRIWDVAVDSAGDVLVCGDTNSFEFPVLGGFDGTYAVSDWYLTTDAFVTKISGDGKQILWSSFYGDVTDEQPFKVLIDDEKNVIVAGIFGYFNPPAEPSPIHAFLFYFKVSSSGDKLLWNNRSLGEVGYQGMGATLDGEGNVFLLTSTPSEDMPVPGGIYEHVQGGHDFYIAELSRDEGEVLWGTYLGGAWDEEAYDIAIDGEGALVLMGKTMSRDIPVPEGYDRVLNTGGAMYIAKISLSTNALVWGTYFGDVGSILWPSMAVDSAGSIYVMANTQSPAMPTPGGYDRTINGNTDMYIAKISSDCELVWGTYLGASGGSTGRDIAVNAAGEVFVTGGAGSLDIPIRSGWEMRGGNFYVAKFDPEGSRLLLGSCIGGTGGEEALSMALDASGNIVLAGMTDSIDFPTTNGSDHTYDGFGDGAIVKVTDPTGLGRDLYVPAVAHTQGAYGTSWRTDGMVLNPGDGKACYDLYYYAAGAETLCESRCLTGHAAWNYSDIVGAVCGMEGDSVAGMRIHADGNILMTTRTYTQREDGGTYGQFMEAVEAGMGIWPGTVGHLIGIKQNADYRTNIGFSEVTGQETEVLLRLYDSSNSLLHTSSFILLPSGWQQVGLPDLGISSLDVGRAEVEVNTGGAVLAYASVVDNRTGDAIAIPAKKVFFGSLHNKLIAAIAHSPGAYGTFWQTDLWLCYLFGTTSISLLYQSSTATYEASISLSIQKPVEVQDAVATLFPGAGDGAGSLHLENSSGILALSRTYNNDTDGGTYGQFIPPKGGKQLMSLAEPRWLLQLQCNNDYRTNVGFSEYEGRETRASLKLFDVNGALLGESTYSVPADQNLQINTVFEAMGVPCASTAAFARVEVLSGGSLYAYASVVDNRTGDAIFIPGLE